MYDPFAVRLYAEIREKIGDAKLVGHLPCEMSRFGKIGTMAALVRQIKLSKSPLLQRGLKILISLRVKKCKVKMDDYQK